MASPFHLQKFMEFLRSIRNRDYQVQGVDANQFRSPSPGMYDTPLPGMSGAARSLEESMRMNSHVPAEQFAMDELQKNPEQLEQFLQRLLQQQSNRWVDPRGDLPMLNPSRGVHGKWM